MEQNQTKSAVKSVEAYGVTVAEAFLLEKPCGGQGKCGKCRVLVSGELEPLTQVEIAAGLSDMPEQADKRGSYSAGFYERFACQAICRGRVNLLLSENHTETTTALETASFAAVDIGTTTLEVRRYDENGRILGEYRRLNPQRRFGSDVISRIGAADGHRQELTDCLRESLREMVGKCGFAVVTGNTVMLHLFVGLSVEAMGRYPFTPESLFGYETDGVTLGLDCQRVYLPPCISAFIGADTVCALLAADLREKELLCDLGTNGELAYHVGTRYICASTAAGPALEGVEISCGMRAESGAIDRICYRNGGYDCHVIGGGKASGLCGSGLISATAAMRDSGEMDESGYIGHSVTFADGVTLCENDIRALQLAKSAIRAGIDCILGAEKPSKILLAGNFGGGLDISAAKKIGLLPDCHTVEIIGNAALDGAKMLFSPDNRKKAEHIAANAAVLSLDSDENFTERFFADMMFY